MRRTFSDGIREYEFLEPEELLDFSSLDEAVRFLRPFLADESTRGRILDLANERFEGVRGAADEEAILRELAFQLVSGRFRIAFAGPTIKPEVAMPVEPPPPPPPPKSPPPPQKKKESSDTEGVDPASQADTLKRAAEEGQPFCEECEKAKKALEEKMQLTPPPPPTAPPPEPAPRSVFHAPTPSPGPPMDVDPEAQANTLKRAAENGVPFCEECERARQAQQQKAAPQAT